MTKNTDQEINGNVTVRGTINLASDDVEINHLTSDNSVFGVKLQKLLDDCYFESSNDSIIVTNNKFFNNLSIGELVVENDFWQAGLSTEEIINRFEDIRNGIRVQGPLTFSSIFNITNLTVAGSINDISSSNFGRQWLLSRGKQVGLRHEKT